MKKIFTALVTVIVTQFIMKVVDRIKNPPVPTRDELHEEVLRKKRAYDEMVRNRPMRRVSSVYNTPEYRTLREVENAAELAGVPQMAAEGCAIGSCNGR